MDARGTFDAQGYVVARGLFSPAEAAAFRDHYMAMRARGPLPGDMANDDGDPTDPLVKFPRMVHMHRHDETSLRFLLDERLTTIVRDLIGDDAYAVQTMIYFKPPGARGQAMHQDNFYLAARPGNCLAAWLALDRADEDAGCLRVVPGSHTWPILCTEPADFSESFTDTTVPLPPGTELVPVELEPGDVMFFHGCLVHGSLRNRTTDRFRRSLIAHYVDGTARRVTGYVAHAAMRLDGSPADLEPTDEGGPCGVWVDADGRRVIEMADASGPLQPPI